MGRLRYTDPVDIRRHTKGRKIAAMWDYFGMLDGCYCENCCHLENHGYWKCRIYGISASEATDWVKGWTACRAYNVEGITKATLYKTLRYNTPKAEEEKPLDGQMNVFGGIEAINPKQESEDE